MLSQAEKIAMTMGNDGSTCMDSDGRALGFVCRGDHATVESREEMTRYTFEDGSAIIEIAGRWDVRHADCTCGWCWEARPTKIPACVERAEAGL